MDLVTILREVEDPRRDHLKEHSLECIFYITIAAVICGAESWYGVAEFGKMKEPFFRSRIKDFKGVPSHDTFNRVFSILDPKELERGFRIWIDEICGKYRGIVSIDGKEICGAKTQKKDGSFEPLRMVSAWAASNGVTLGQEKVGKKSNEIKAIPKLVKALDLEGCVVTIDAMGCQHKIVQTIIENKADFVICVKDNQKKLHNEIKSWFSGIDFEGNKVNGHGHIPPTRYQASYTEECRHGRKEKRYCQVYNNGLTEDILGWQGVHSVVCQTKITTYLKKAHPIISGANTIKYYLCRMENEVLLSLVSLMLPENILSRFSIVNVEKGSDAILIYLDEKIDVKYGSNDLFESKGFLNPVTIRDFPLRDKAVDLVVRRRRWINRQTNESFTAPYDEFKAESVRYSKEFAAFLKEVYGDQTYDLPFA